MKKLFSVLFALALVLVSHEVFAEKSIIEVTDCKDFVVRIKTVQVGFKVKLGCGEVNIPWSKIKKIVLLCDCKEFDPKGCPAEIHFIEKEIGIKKMSVGSFNYPSSSAWLKGDTEFGKYSIHRSKIKQLTVISVSKK